MVDAVVAVSAAAAAVAAGVTAECADATADTDRRGLEVYGDSAYGTGAARAAYRAGGHDTVIKPKPLRPAVPGGFTLDDFSIDEPAGTVTCPGGYTRAMTPKRTVTFGALCAECPLRDRCTTARDGRSMSIHEHEHLPRAARAQARTPEFERDYPTRSRVERIIAWLATQRGRRVKLRYHGVDKNHAWLRNRAAAINLRTLVNAGLTATTGPGPWPDRRDPPPPGWSTGDPAAESATHQPNPPVSSANRVRTTITGPPANRLVQRPPSEASPLTAESVVQLASRPAGGRTPPGTCGLSGRPPPSAAPKSGDRSPAVPPAKWLFRHGACNMERTICTLRPAENSRQIHES